MRTIRASFAFIIVVMSASCAPLSSYQTPIATLATQMKALNEALDKELTQFTSNQRIDYSRFEVRRLIDMGRSAQPAPFTVEDVETLLCVPRDRLARRGESAKYLNAMSASLTSVAAKPSDDIAVLARQLFTSYAISVPYSDKNGQDELCRLDIKNYPRLAYPIGQPEAGAAAALVGIQTLWSIVKPLATSALQQVDSARRASELSAFLKHPTNQQNIAKAIQDSRNTLKQSSDRRRYLAVLGMSNARDELNNALASQNLQKIASCQAYYKAKVPLDKAAEDPNFRTCYRTVWTAVESKVQALVTAGNTYDTAAATEPTPAFKKLEDVTTRLTQIAEGKVDAEIAADMFEALSNLHSLLSAIEKTVADPATEKKISDAIKQIRQAL